jgi:hypothetical protein
MAAVPSKGIPPRSKASVQPQEERPQRVIPLIYSIVDSGRRTRNALFLIIGVSVAVYTVLAAAKGIHLHLHLHGLIVPVSSSVIGGTSLTYWIAKMVGWLRRRFGATATDNTQTTES